jgi:hypothetical protein
MKCDICGKENLKTGLNPYTLFGQKICSFKCLEKRAEKNVPEGLKKALTNQKNTDTQ